MYGDWTFIEHKHFSKGKWELENIAISILFQYIFSKEVEDNSSYLEDSQELKNWSMASML